MRHSAKLLATGAICGALVAGTSALAIGATTPRAPGVTPTEVNVGAIVTQSGGLAADFAPYLSGVKAYFDYVNNDLKGVSGRKLNLKWPLDDASNPNTNISDAHTLVSVDHAFAIVGVSTPFFNASKYLSTTSTPVFGYATGNVWGGPKNFFADYGSVLDYSSSVPFFAYVAKQTNTIRGAKVAVIALSYPASQDECKGAIKGLKAYHVKIVYSNISEPFGANWSIEATKIRNAHANMIVNCMDVNSNISLSKSLANYGLHPTQLWLDGYDRTILGANASDMKNVYLMLQHVPFEAATSFPKSFPGLNLYFKEMTKYGFGTAQYSDVALMGWESANVFTEGLRAAGKNPTQGAVIAAINRITRDTGGPAGGVTAPINWKIAHKGNTSPACETFVKTKGSTFTLAFNHGAHPWICFPLHETANLNKPVKPPAGTPGA